MSDLVENFIGGKTVATRTAESFDKFSPASGELICRVANSGSEDLDAALEAASLALESWAGETPVQRGALLRRMAAIMERDAAQLAQVAWRETGKSLRDASGEVQAAIEQAYFMAGEGRRMFARTTTSAMAERTSIMVRQPVGIAGLITPANTPFPNVAWKLFPALVCGNSVVLKPSEDAPLVARAFALVAEEAGLPAGVFNIVHGGGGNVGAALVRSEKIGLVSFTGSTEVGRWIGETAGRRLARVFLELGGKNPLVVCDDADLDNAVKWTVLSAFSNAGQRCSSASRIIVFDQIYDPFRERLIEATAKLKVGDGDEDDLGPVINERQLSRMTAIVERALSDGARVAAGGRRLTEPPYDKGCYMAPTIIEDAKPHSAISRDEVFGPVTCLYRVKDLDEAIALSNHSDYGLTACIHTGSVHRAMRYAHAVHAGVANINTGTYGSEPHMPFGGVKQSGNGLREPGVEALDVYSELKNININYLPGSG